MDDDTGPSGTSSPCPRSRSDISALPGPWAWPGLVLLVGAESRRCGRAARPERLQVGVAGERLRRRSAEAGGRCRRRPSRAAAAAWRFPAHGGRRRASGRRRRPNSPRRFSSTIEVVRLPGAQHVGAGAGGVRLQPFVAEVAVRLVRHRLLLVDDGGHDGGQDVVEERRRVGLVGGDRELGRAGRLDQLSRRSPA